MCFSYADKVSVDDDVLVQTNDKFTPDKVTNVSSFMMQGLHSSLCFFLQIFSFSFLKNEFIFFTQSKSVG